MEKNKDRIKINNHVFTPFISRDEIRDLVAGIAKRINRDYEGKHPVFVIVLKGSVFFGADLLREIDIDCRIETVSAKSYGSNMKGNENVELALPDLKIKGEDVIVIEDIVDSGRTLSALIGRLEAESPASLEIAALLSKPDKLETPISVKYLGREIPGAFVIGYGMDYAESGRNLADIYAEEKAGI